MRGAIFFLKFFKLIYPEFFSLKLNVSITFEMNWFQKIRLIFELCHFFLFVKLLFSLIKGEPHLIVCKK